MRTRIPLATAVVVASFVAASCTSSGVADTPSPSTPTSGGRPASTAKLSILSPTNGQVIHGGTVALKVSLKDAKIVPATSAVLKPNEGHLHVILDNLLISMTTGLQISIPNVPPGPHLLKVEFVANDHAPFDPRVIAAVAFRMLK
jgi:hypothetical protein